MLFPSLDLVRRVERAEADALSALVASLRGEVRSLAGGVALHRGSGSPLNKLVGLGFEPLEEAALAEVEQQNTARDLPTQLELSTYADAAVTCLLAQRGYRLTGFENVLGRELAGLVPNPGNPALSVRRAAPSELETWVDVLATGFGQLAGEEQAAAHDAFDRSALEGVFRDMAAQTTLEQWVALLEGRIVGGASMSVRDGVTQLFGAATLPAARRRGVQTALLHARLQAGQARGSDVAVITTQPGSKSHHNAQRAGFTLLYARAVWVKLPTPH